MSFAISMPAFSICAGSGSARATAEHSPEAIASRRMFIPHQPDPMSAVLYFLPGWALRRGAAERADFQNVRRSIDWIISQLRVR